MRQGVILSALLFAVYLADIIQSVNIEHHGCLLGIQKNNIQAYADDVAVCCPNSSGLSKLLQVFTQKAKDHDLVIKI